MVFVITQRDSVSSASIYPRLSEDDLPRFPIAEHISDAIGCRIHKPGYASFGELTSSGAEKLFSEKFLP
jgi:hypothetical protein